MAMMSSCDGNNSDSNEIKMAQYEKADSEFKATLKPGNVIIEERIDSVVQKMFYLVPNTQGTAPNAFKNIEMHDYAKNGALFILPLPVSDNIGEICRMQSSLWKWVRILIALTCNTKIWS